MKATLSAQRVALLALALGTASVTATFAQTTNTPSTTPPTCSAGGGHHHQGDSILTADEKAQLKAARQAAFAADPTLKTEAASLRQQFENLKSQGKGGATKAQWQALREQRHDFETKLHAAELNADPTVAPILTKLEAAKKNWHHHSAGGSATP
jgi:Spy/CpxP family protein refolding chaperone